MRFEMKRRYRTKNTWLPSLLWLLMFAVAAAFVMRGVERTAELSERDGLRAAETAVRQAAVSCYALEGAYPPSYEELKRRSGIALDEKDYVVFYEIFASNIMPEVTVLRRGEAAQ